MNQKGNQKATSVFAATLAGTPPTTLRPPPQGAVHIHSIDTPSVRAGVTSHPRVGLAPKTTQPTREFTSSDKALIRKVHGYMSSPLQLLGILNERLACDHVPAVTPYTIEQLHAEIASVSSAVPASGGDWASLRKALAKAKCAGVLDGITEQVINDFAVVYSLNQKQVLTLKDIVLQPKEEEA